jgi:hypothetical protein
MHVSWRYCYDGFLCIIFKDETRFLLPEILSKICVNMVVHSTIDEIANPLQQYIWLKVGGWVINYKKECDKACGSRV